ncbi:MAG: hypothetical protein ACE5G6_06255 [Terriglobia bacterium]
MARPLLADYEIYLPLRYNNGRKISQAKFDTTFREIIGRYGGYTLKKNIQGQVTYSRKETMHLMSVHTYDSPANDRWFRRYKVVLKQRFKQREIYITKKRLTLL